MYILIFVIFEVSPRGLAIAQRLFGGCSLWKSGFESKTFCVGSFVDKVALGQVISEYFGVSPVIPLVNSSI
jgi:hypothetical protein